MKFLSPFLALAVLAPNLAAAQEIHDKVLFIEWGGNYVAYGSLAYAELQRLTPNTEYVNLASTPGGVEEAIEAANAADDPFDQIWSYDLSAGPDVRGADIQAVADWYADQSGGHVIADGRFLGSYFRGRQADEGRKVATNYYTNLKEVGGGVVIATDHNSYANGGTNPMAALMGVDPFTGNFGGFLPFDTASVLFTNPLTVTFLSNDTSTGQAPVGTLPNGLVLTPVAYHSNNTLTPGISSTFGSSFNLNVTIDAPTDNYLLCPPDDGVTAVATVEGSVGDVAYSWISTLDGALGDGQSFELNASDLSEGTHEIRVVAEDRFSADGASVIVQVGGDLCDDDDDGILNGEDQCPGFDDALNEDGDALPDDCDPCFGELNDQDADQDGVCDDQDECTGDDAQPDTDGDGVCEDLDQCLGDDAQPDTDGDGICEDIDDCLGDDAAGDTDNDGVCDDLDECLGDDSQPDTDGDGICEDIDECLGDDAQPDTDDDGICEDIDECLGDDAQGDSDGDGICEDIDECLGDDAQGDSDGDGICEDVDDCTGDDALGDTDDDGICEDIDECTGNDARGDTDGDGICEDIDLCIGDDNSFDGDADGYCADLDCRDDDADAYPGADEQCNGLDDDCDEEVPADEADFDGDLFRICDGDCDDDLASIYDGAPELCDELDNNCDGTADEGFEDTNNDGTLDCLEDDLDDDGQSPFEGDCDDTNADIYTGALELCDGLDNDCDGDVPAAERDSDNDGFTECEGDCDDDNDLVGPNALELCDGLDNDCDGELGDDEVDNDDDGVLACDDSCDEDPDISTGACEDPLSDENSHVAGGCSCDTSPTAPLSVLLPLMLGGLLLRRRRSAVSA
ncbi:MAG: MYXO-CTERM domain-containing protein [bacterium]|jgi:MYXO-CTERM domain-containing protein